MLADTVEEVIIAGNGLLKGIYTLGDYTYLVREGSFTAILFERCVLLRVTVKLWLYLLELRKLHLSRSSAHDTTEQRQKDYFHIRIIIIYRNRI